MRKGQKLILEISKLLKCLTVIIKPNSYYKSTLVG